MSSMIKKKSRKYVILIAIAAIVVIILAIFYKGYSNAAEKYEETIQKLEQEVERLSEPVAVYEEASQEIDIAVINAEIRDIGELATIEYLYTDAGKYEDPAELFGKEIPFSFTTKSFIAKWDGSIKAGVDISKVRAEVNEEKKEITIHIPKAEILSHEIDDESIETLDERDGLFNKLKIEDIRAFDANSKDAMERRAIENGLLDKAYENARTILYKLVYTDAVTEAGYTVVIEGTEE
ncbi:MAG: DUF4230 domain-containing protein [Lachnospiraceae bacterium]|nr:DUF4230 domain-containing protein [Lachnospiraceae bacterium]